MYTYHTHHARAYSSPINHATMTRASPRRREFFFHALFFRFELFPIPVNEKSCFFDGKFQLYALWSFLWGRGIGVIFGDILRADLCGIYNAIFKSAEAFYKKKSLTREIWIDSSYEFFFLSRSHSKLAIDKQYQVEHDIRNKKKRTFQRYLSPKLSISTSQASEAKH